MTSLDQRLGDQKSAGADRALGLEGKGADHHNVHGGDYTRKWGVGQSRPWSWHLSQAFWMV